MYRSGRGAARTFKREYRSPPRCLDVSEVESASRWASPEPGCVSGRTLDRRRRTPSLPRASAVVMGYEASSNQNSACGGSRAGAKACAVSAKAAAHPASATAMIVAERGERRRSGAQQGLHSEAARSGGRPRPRTLQADASSIACEPRIERDADVTLRPHSASVDSRATVSRGNGLVEKLAPRVPDGPTAEPIRNRYGTGNLQLRSSW